MFTKRSTAIMAVLAALGTLTASFLFGFGLGRSTPQALKVDLQILEEVRGQIESSAIDPGEDRKLVQGAIRGMLESLEDPYASYLDPQARRSLDNSLSGHFSGVGMVLKREDKVVKVVSVLSHTPAAIAGITPGDVVVTVNRKAVDKLTLDEVVQRIQGAPGTTIKLSISRGGGPPEDLVLERRRIEIPTVEAKLLKGRVGLIELISFPEEAGSKVREAVESLEKRGARGYILDLRGNPGGLLDEAVNVASVFLAEGPVVSYKQRGKRAVKYDTRGEPQTQRPLVVLVDEGSASASEVVAGAIQDRGRGIVVGTETYGKGAIQTIFPLSDGSAIKLTIASYFTPSGRSIGEQGVIPDVAVLEKTMQLARAQAVLSGLLAENPART